MRYRSLVNGLLAARDLIGHQLRLGINNASKSCRTASLESLTRSCVALHIPIVTIMMKMLCATLLSLLIASASAQSHNITISSPTSGKCLEVRDFAHVKSGSAVQMLVFYFWLFNNSWNFLIVIIIIFRNDCNDSVAQVWSYYYRGDARAQIRLGHLSPNFCLDAVNGQ